GKTRGRFHICRRSDPPSLRLLPLRQIIRRSGCWHQKIRWSGTRS
ncbi:hypothetical protein LINGRAPRIM_LOCUS322, partial [Linum grandiflorum]